MAGEGVADSGLEAISGLAASVLTACTKIPIADIKVTVRMITKRICSLAWDDTSPRRSVVPTIFWSRATSRTYRMGWRPPGVFFVSAGQMLIRHRLIHAEPHHVLIPPRAPFRTSGVSM